MRLLKANSITSPAGLSLVDRVDDDAAPYAVLSHTWGEGEVLFEHVMNGTAASRAAYPKVVHACQQALDDGYEYVWIDTCCIEKTSSADLSEAINSMFAWYKDAAVCYAYLSDFGGGARAFESARWFTRGWTLQELIAPSKVVFYGAGWVEIGTKYTLRSVISQITRVGEDILAGERSIETTSIANRMGWASERVTSRTEDIAYCLFGLFDVNMPLLYGEGTKAFVRLQEEILKKTNDHTLFAWVDEEAPEEKQHGLLAPSPQCFRRTHMLLPYELPLLRTPITITNEGLSIELRLRGVHKSSGDELFAALLDCPTPDFEEECWFLIYIKRTASHNRYARVRASRFGKVRLPSLPAAEDYRRILVRPEPRGHLFETDKHYFTQLLSFRCGPPPNTYRVVDAAHYPSGRKVKPVQTAECDLGSGSHVDWTRVVIRRAPGRLTAALLFERVGDGQRVLVSFGAYDRVSLGFHAVEMPLKNPEAEDIPGRKAMQSAFVPTVVGSSVELPSHIVRVMSEHSVEDMVKIHEITVEIEPKWSLDLAALQAEDEAFSKMENATPEAQSTSPQSKERSMSKNGVLDRLISCIPEGLSIK